MILDMIFGKPDPKRFSVGIGPAPNWFGELEGKNKKERGINERVVRVSGSGTTGDFEFPDASPFDGLDITPELTTADIQSIRARGYNPQNPTYAIAKRYFSKNPLCSKKELSENSKPPNGDAMAVETAKDIVAIFRQNALKK